MSKWETVYPYYEISQFEPRPAIYAFLDTRDGLFYIGETQNMRARMHQHGITLARYSCSYKTAQFGWIGDFSIKVSYSRRFGEESMRERRLIRRLHPSLNYRGLKKWKAEATPLKKA